MSEAQRVLSNPQKEVKPLQPGLPYGILAQLTISVLKDGRTRLSGPLHQPKICLAMLQDAANVINANTFNAAVLTPETSIIVPG